MTDLTNTSPPVDDARVTWRRDLVGGKPTLWLYHKDGGNTEADAYHIALIEQIEANAAPSPTADEARTLAANPARRAIKHIREALRSLPAEYATSRHHPADHLMAAIGCIETLSRVPSEEATDGFDALRIEFAKSQFMTVSSGGGGKASVEFAFYGDDRLKRSHDLHDAFIKAAKSITRAPGAGT